MTRWNVKRVWRVVTGADEAAPDTQFSTVDLARFRCVVLLGAAGAGKTTEARLLADHERAARCVVHERRLAEYTELAGCLTQLARGANAATRFHLDALDEAMMPERRRWLAVKHWIEQDLRETGASIRITCRTAVWPPELSDELRGFCGSESFATAYLQPLTEDDVDVAAESTDIDPNTFRAEIEKARAQSLARHPLTLRMLLGLSKDGHGLPSTLKDLFDEGVRMLARDGRDRRVIGTHTPLPLDVAERLACYTVLTGRETVNLGDDVAASQLGLQDLSGHVAEDELRAVGTSGLCDSGEPGTFRFAHRQFAEYLAGRRLARLPMHQSCAFLAGPEGWRSGVAGPLRETAAFAAMFDTDLAVWLSSRDPEVVGLSDVADDALRRQATLDLLDRFRSGTLAAGELYRGGMELSGFQYEGAETDLRPVLQERGDRCEHVLACAISLIGSWRLSSMSDALADLVLDSPAPMHARTLAGYALLKCGADAARERLKPLVSGPPEDDRDQMKGIALQCNWPDRLSAPELFDALTPRQRQSFSGAYEVFLYKLDSDGFPPAGQVAAGLRWATSLASEPSDTDSLHRLGMRIAHAALQELDDREIATGLVSLMQRWMKFWKSPLAPLREDPLSPPSNDSVPLYADRRVRRKLIDLLTEFVVSTKEFRTLAFETPGLLHEEDFQWLLQRGCDDGRVVDVRERYLEIAAFLPWRWRPGDVEAWLRVCDDVDPVKNILGNQKSIDLDSEQATRLREDWKSEHDREQETEPQEIDPPPRERVLEVLALSEAKDVGYFPTLCRELTLEPRSTHYGSGRFLTDMPGWREAAPGTRIRIVEAAKRYLSMETIAETLSSRLAPNTHHIGGLDAMWLVLDRDPDWLISRPESWWNGWCRYILAESILNMAGEPADPKLRLVALLNGGAPSSVCREVLHLLSSNETHERHRRLSDALRLLADQANTRLDEKLCDALERGKVQEEDIVDVAEFVLRRAEGRSLPMCCHILENAGDRPEGSQAEHVAVALLRNRLDASWTALKKYLDADADRARRILKAFADGEFYEFRIIGSVSTQQLGELAGILLNLFPPDEDEDGGGVVGSVDTARFLRDQLISHLGRLRDEQSVDAFRRLEQRLGDRYPWLAGARIRVERAYRLTRWSPFPVDVIADVMDAETRRLLRSDEDVVDGIECVLDQYAEALRRDGMESVEDLWNTANGAAPSPKAEEHVSRKLCGVVRSYFQRYAVTADREVEIYRRSVSRSEGGQPGSEVDILVRVSGRGAVERRRDPGADRGQAVVEPPGEDGNEGSACRPIHAAGWRDTRRPHRRLDDRAQPGASSASSVDLHRGRASRVGGRGETAVGRTSGADSGVGRGRLVAVITGRVPRPTPRRPGPSGPCPGRS